MKKYTIYQITNIIDGKIYIGKHETFDINDSYMGSGKILKSAQSKHGLENFKKEILHIFDTEEEMNAKEAELVTEDFCLREDTYNICPGGKGGWGYINSNGLCDTSKGGKNSLIFTDNARWKQLCSANAKTHNEKMKLKKKGIYSSSFNHATCGMENKKHTNETKSKMSRSHTGLNNSQYGSAWITNGSSNKKIKAIDIIPEGWYKGRVAKNNLAPSSSG